MIKAPWTLNQVAGLNDYQRNGYTHPFTCGAEDRSDRGHTEAAKRRGDRDSGLLEATLAGWICPACDYTQDWAHAFMFKGRGRNPLDGLGFPPTTADTASKTGASRASEGREQASPNTTPQGEES